MTRRLEGLTVEAAVASVTTALGAEGFGILSDIDVQATLDAKIGVAIPGYRILGACSPALAHQALSAEPAIGLLMPCNVVVTEAGDGATVVSIADPVALFEPLKRDDLSDFALEVRAQLRRALDSL
ncbi:MAG: DUF302 domain-containing protein [Myxococcota bacterium]|nr:DUF302 domain-containing protein [Myxococcota bacterium]